MFRFPAILFKISGRCKALFYFSYFIHGPRERLVVGKRVSLANTLFNTRSGKIIIEDGVMFGHNVMVLTGVHDIVTRGSQGMRPTLTDAGKDIIIKKGAWIGSGAIILGPVVVGQDSVVGAGSVVTKDIADEVLSAGNPARTIRKIEYSV